MTTIARRTVGFQTINNSVFATIDRVEKIGEKFVATSGLELGRGTASWVREYSTKAAALAALKMREGTDESMLAAPWTATMVNPRSGMLVEKVTFDPAQRIRKVEKVDEGWSALVSSDGIAWYVYVGDEKPFTR